MLFSHPSPPAGTTVPGSGSAQTQVPTPPVPAPTQTSTHQHNVTVTGIPNVIGIRRIPRTTRINQGPPPTPQQNPQIPAPTPQTNAQTPGWFRRNWVWATASTVGLLLLIGLFMWRPWEGKPVPTPIDDKSFTSSINAELEKLRLQEQELRLEKLRRKGKMWDAATRPSKEVVEYMVEVQPRSAKGVMYAYLAPAGVDTYGFNLAGTDFDDSNIIKLDRGCNIGCTDVLERAGIQLRADIDGVEFYADKADGISYKANKDGSKEIYLESSTKGRESTGIWKRFSSSGGVITFGDPRGGTLYHIWYEEPSGFGPAYKSSKLVTSLILSPYTPEEIKRNPRLMEQLRIKKTR